MKILRQIEEFFQNSPVPQAFIQEHRAAIVAHLDEKAFQRAYYSNFRYFLIFFPLVVGFLNYTKNEDFIILLYWGFFSIATTVGIWMGRHSKSAGRLQSAKYFLEVAAGFGVVLTAILAGHVESTGFVTRGGPIQFSFIIQAANPFWYDREKLVLRGFLLGAMAYFFAGHFYADFYGILISQILIGVSVSIIFTLLLHSSEISQVYIKTLADKEKHELEIDNAHAWGQISRMIHPHQHHLLKMGHVLEETMSLEKKPAMVGEFDFKSSGILSSLPEYDVHKSNLFRDLSNTFFYDNYRFSSEWDDMRVPTANGYLFKDMGDGFIYTIGHPFRSEHENRAEQSVQMAFEMISYSKKYFKKHLDVDPRICIALVSSMVQGLWKAANVTEYDFTDGSIIPIARLSSFRRILETRGAIAKTASQILIKQDVFDALKESKHLFVPINLMEFELSLRESADRFVYVHVIH